MPLIQKNIQTPIGVMHAMATDEGICMFDFPHRRMIDHIRMRIVNGAGGEPVDGEHPHIALLEQQVLEYFTGQRTSFDLPLHMIGSEFQKKVWNALLNIPYGTTVSYQALTNGLGDEKAIRAVAKANGENGMAILIPCHRVIGKNGSLTGYAGGLRNKEWLLNHERKNSGKTLQQSLFMNEL